MCLIICFEFYLTYNFLKKVALNNINEIQKLKLQKAFESIDQMN